MRKDLTLDVSATRPPAGFADPGAGAAGLAAPGSRIVNAMSVDVEDYFQVSAFESHIPRAHWDTFDTRVERNVERLLEILEQHRTHATFFVLGWVAERHPQLVRRIVAGGHELASHGYSHRRASDQTPDEFRADITRARDALEQTCGRAAAGYRAPSFSIGAGNLWAFDILREAGHRYSSSVYPVRHDHYGMPDAPRFPYSPREGLIEIPISTTELFGHRLPVGGGGWFRLLPYEISRRAIARVNRIDRAATVFYLHPWEIDPAQPRVPGLAWKSRFRHYINLRQTEARLHRLLSDFRWDRVDRVFGIDAGP